MNRLSAGVVDKMDQWAKEALMFCAAHGRKGGQFAFPSGGCRPNTGLAPNTEELAMTCKHCGQEIDFNIGSGPGQAAYLHIAHDTDNDADHNAEPDESPVTPEMTADYNDSGH